MPSMTPVYDDAAVWWKGAPNKCPNLEYTFLKNEKNNHFEVFNHIFSLKGR